jgi:choline dehydrogenase-like flavoprotein
VSGRIVRGNEIATDTEIAADVCVIGTGAGGAVLAAELAAAGKKVVMLEEGGYHTREEFDMQEGHMYPLLYQDRGSRATADQSIVILQGRAVGGSTVVNFTTCFRTPEKTLAHWKDRWGVEGLTTEALTPHWEKVEARLGIHQVELEGGVNKNNRVIWDGATKLGWTPTLLKRNVRNCHQSGYCGMGCPFDAKQAMQITFVPDALAADADLYCNARVDLLERDGNAITKVRATVLDPATDKPSGKTITVKAAKVALCGGAINDPRLLLKSGITDGPVGKRGWFHPLVISTALMPYRVEAFYGAPQSVSCHQFAWRDGGKMGFFVEAAPIHPMLAAVGMVGFGKDHREKIEKLPWVNALYAHLVDGFSDEETGATVTLRPSGAPKVDYAFTERLWEAAREGMKSIARLQLAAGAEKIYTLHAQQVEIQSEADLDKIDRAPVGPNRIPLFTAHLMGGCQMGAKAEESVVRSDFRHHRVENLWIVDGSVFPSSLGVNPSLTIYGLASYAAGILAKA